MATGQMSGVIRHLRGAALQHDGGGVTDGQLLECFITHQDEAAFEAVVRRHGPMVLGVCRRILRNHHDAEDAFQATFLVLARKATSIGQRELLGNWLYGAAYRAALEVKAARRRVRERQVSAMAEPEAVAEAESGLDLRPVLDQELSRLPDKYRVPVVLCDLEGRTRRDVARQLGIPAGTLSGRLTTARRLLARRLARHGFALSGGALAAALSGGAVSACVPSPLVASTVKGAARLAAGQAAAGVISDKVLVLSEGVMKSMLLTKLKAMAALAVVLLVGTTVVWSYGVLAEEPAARQPNPGPRPAARDADQPREAAPVRKDLNGDPLPPGALARLGGVRFRSVAIVHHLAMSPDGKSAAVAGTNNAIRLLDLVTGEEIRKFPGHKGGVKGIWMSPDGKTLASKGDDHRTSLWDVANGKERYNMPGTHVIFSPDSEVLFTIAKGPTIRLLDAATGKLLRSWAVPGGKPFSNIASWTLSPDGKILVTGRNDTDEMGKPKNYAVYLWEVATGKEIRKIAGPEGFVEALAVSPDGKRLASGGPSPAHLGPDGKLVATAPKIHLWDIATGKEVRTLEGPRWVRQLIFSPDGKTLLSSDSSEGMIRRWDVTTGKETAQYRVPGATTFGPMSLLPGGKTLLVACGAGLQLLDLASGKEVRSPRAKGHRSFVYRLSYSPDSKSLLSTGDTETLMWDVATSKITHEFKNSGGSMARFSPDGKTLCKRGVDNHLELWDVATHKRIRQIEEPKNATMRRSFGFSPDGKTLISGSSAGVRLYDVATGKILHGFDSIQDAKFSPDGKTLGALSKEDWFKGEEPKLDLWDVATRKRVRQFELEKLGPFEVDSFLALEFSPDGKILAVSRHSAVCLLDVATGKLIRKLPLNGKQVFMAFSPDGKTLATGGWFFTHSIEDRDVHLWETATGKEIGTLKGHRGGVIALAYSPDGKTLATGGTDSTILIWDVSGRGQ
jgi:RNA polymerase sigma factor (sigma-70 family)